MKEKLATTKYEMVEYQVKVLDAYNKITTVKLDKIKSSISEKHFK